MNFESELRDGRKLKIGRAQEDDAAEIVAYVNRVGGESDFLTFGAGEFDISAEDERKFIAGLQDGQSDFMLKGVVDGQIVSVCTLLTAKKRERVKHVGEFGISVAVSHWGLGIGRRMCDATISTACHAGVRKINLKVREDNPRAIHLYKSMGFQDEGLSPRAYQVAGRFFSDRMMGLCIDPPGAAESKAETRRRPPILKTKRLTVRVADENDIPAILKYYRDNEARFAPTDPPKPAEFYSEPFWVEKIRKARSAWAAEQGLSLFIFGEGGSVIGSISFSQMCRGPFHACYLGYSLDNQHEGQGLMTEALQVAIGYVFDELNFHRIMANHLPDNDRSARVLGRLGFTVEGRAANYLFINGQWREHVLNALTNPDWKQELA